MQIKDWQTFRKGYVIIVVTGKAPEKFINLAMVKGIFLWDIKPINEENLEAKVAIEQVKYLRSVARLSRTKFKIVAKKGLPFALRRANKRKGFFIGLAFFLILLYVFSAFIWFVDWSSSDEIEELDMRVVLQVAAGLGLKPGALKYNINTKEIEQAMEISIPQLAWVGIEIKGTRARIHIVEKKLPSKEYLDSGPGNLIALKDGIVYEMLVIEGESLVNPGDTVKKDQILISGRVNLVSESPEEAPKENITKLVKSQGVVRARVWYEGIGEIPLVEKGEKETGKEMTTIRLLILDREIILKGTKESAFNHYKEKKKAYKLPTWRNRELPVEIVRTTYIQTELFSKELDPIVAKELGLAKAREQLMSQINPQGKIVASWETVEDSVKDVIKVKIVVESIENIAGFQSMKEE